MAGPFYARYNPAKVITAKTAAQSPDGTPALQEHNTVEKKRKKHHKEESEPKKQRIAPQESKELPSTFIPTRHLHKESAKDYSSASKSKPGKAVKSKRSKLTNVEETDEAHSHKNDHGKVGNERSREVKESYTGRDNVAFREVLEGGIDVKSIEAGRQATSGVELEKHTLERPSSVQGRQLESDGKPSDTKKKKSKKDRSKTTAPNKNGTDNDDATKKHSSIMSKYAESMRAEAKRKEAGEEDGPIEEAEKPEMNDLVPLPVPQRIGQLDASVPYSHLPTWLSNPVVAGQDITTPFTELPISKSIVTKLHKQGIVSLLPVQAGVLPLLLPTPQQHPGDVCVSAATGSGKTLAYVLPLVESLKKHLAKGLRAVIIVPTRELVNQVREVTSLCIADSDLKLGTAVGAVHMKSEQDVLVAKRTKYDPQKYAERQKKIEAFKKLHADDSDWDSEEQDDMDSGELDMLVDHVVDYYSTVDILIATPGRLVDHIKSTKGFSLANLEWLVIDEADRLLDQSFQDWAEVVLKAVNKRNHRQPPRLFRHDPLIAAALDPGPAHPVRKVMLSATMTQDLDKLAALKLANPKLVVLDGGESQKTLDGDVLVDSSGRFQLPQMLKEFVAPIEEASDKPLYLLQLLRTLFPSSAVVESSKSKLNGTKSDVNDSETSDSYSDSDSSLVSPESDLSSDTDSDLESHSDDASTSEPNKQKPNSALSTSQTTMPVSTDPTIPAALIFTSSNESATRLSHLLNHLAAPPYLPVAPTIHTLTKSTSAASTRALASIFQKRLAQHRSIPASAPSHPILIVATDRASRGLDLPALPYVINYDVPRSLTSYVHRVGRTARAGRSGAAWTLLEGREAAWFWNAIVRADGIDRNGREVTRVKVKVGELGEGAREKYTEALGKLREDVERGK